MQLTRLEIKGFKSFGDKIQIHFNEGITSIVGPNGCGKSNVIDAIRWVLGEQSTRMLRSEKMENIIFNGTKTRKPSNLAEVSLSFDNTRNILPTAFSQVTVTRKLYRNGDSEYRLNDVQCRLKDITDLFLDTGIGADSYSIIELKMIDEIIANKEGSRRALFEEASGISKYKLRKKQTFSKLKDTEDDLSRVDDLLFEIEKNLKTLENQARRAERYHRLKDQYRVVSVQLASFSITTFRTSLDLLEKKEQALGDNRSALLTQTDTLEAALQQQKLAGLTLEKNLSVQQKATNEYTNKIRAYESEKKIKNEQLRFLKEKESRLTDEIAKDRTQLNHVLYTLKRLNEESVVETASAQAQQQKLSDVKQELDELRGQVQSAKAKADRSAAANTELQNRIYKGEKDLAVLHIQRDALLQESTRNMADTDARQTELSEFNRLIAELDTRVGTFKRDLEQKQFDEEELQQQLVDLQERISANRDTLAAESRKLDARQNEYNLTKSLVDNLEGFPESIRFLKKNAAWAKPAPLFSDILFCREDCRVAIENYLEPVMNHYVVETQADAVSAIRLLSDSSRGRASFFVLEALHDVAPGQTPSAESVGTPAIDVITTDDKYLPLCRLLLKNVYLLEQGEEEELGRQLPQNNTVLLARSGKFAKTRTGMSGGSIGLFEGKRIGRARNLENLAKEIKTLETAMSTLRRSVEADQERLQVLRNSSRKLELQRDQQELNRLHNELISVQTKQEQYLAFIENSRHRRQDIEEKIQSVAEEIRQTEPQLAELKIVLQSGTREHTELMLEYNELAELVSVRSATFNLENIRFHQQQNKVAGIAKDLEYREVQQEALDKRMDANTLELDKAQAGILDILKDTDDSDEDLLAMYAEKEALEQGVHEAEQEYGAARAAINAAEEQLSLLRRSKDEAERLNNELKDQKNGLKLELNALKERLSAEFSLDIADLLDTEPPEDESESELREKSERFKKQLNEFGAINPMAMEAYREMEERYTFIKTQKQDLLDAKQSLLETIKEIDDTAKEKFMSAFTGVRENFITVFRSLFNEEDSCDLVLTDPSRPLESDIDILARPKGKRPLSINQLSGGEKTLTATALLFSLYLLKPAPFCIFDEVDAPLDDTNIDKFNNIIRKFSDRSQFIIVSHNKRTIASTDIIYGVTMVEQGISRVVPVDLREVAGTD